MEGLNTLLEAVQYFKDEMNCIRYLAGKRWPNGVVVCPTCGSTSVGFLENQKRWQCSARHPKRQFSIKVGTIMEDSPIGLDKWLSVLWLIANCKNAISSWEIHRDLGVTQKTAWFMLHRVRLAMQDDLTGGNLGGEVEVDETFIGGKARNMHKKKLERVQKMGGRNLANKSIVIGALERKGRVRATVTKDRVAQTMQAFVVGNVKHGTQLYSDEAGKNWRMREEYPDHLVVNHLETYVNGNVHTNGIENFWSLLKRGLNGTYISVEPYHLFRYVDEQAFRFNNRKRPDGEKMNDRERFDLVCGQILGRRLTYKQLTAKEGQRPEVESF
jgi:transposase-like protein